MVDEQYFISRNYRAAVSASSKAKIDCEQALEKLGFKNLGLPRTNSTSTLPNFFATLLGTLIGRSGCRGFGAVCAVPNQKYYDLIVTVANSAAGGHHHRDLRSHCNRKWRRTWNTVGWMHDLVLPTTPP